MRRVYPRHRSMVLHGFKREGYMLRTLAMAAVFGLASISAHAAVTSNAVTSNAVTSNAVTSNAVTSNAIIPNGLHLNGSAANGGSLGELNGVTVESVSVPAPR